MVIAKGYLAASMVVICAGLSNNYGKIVGLDLSMRDRAGPAIRQNMATTKGSSRSSSTPTHTQAIPPELSTWAGKQQCLVFGGLAWLVCWIAFSQCATDSTVGNSHQLSKQGKEAARQHHTIQQHICSQDACWPYRYFASFVWVSKKSSEWWTGVRGQIHEACPVPLKLACCHHVQWSMLSHHCYPRFTCQSASTVCAILSFVSGSKMSWAGPLFLWYTVYNSTASLLYFNISLIF